MCEECNNHWCFILPANQDTRTATSLCQYSSSFALCHSCALKPKSQLKNKSTNIVLNEATQSTNVSPGKVPATVLVHPDNLESSTSTPNVSPLKKRNESSASLPASLSAKKKFKPAQFPGLREPPISVKLWERVDTPANEIKRFESTSSRESKFLHNIPTHHKKQFIHLVRHHLGLVIPKSEASSASKYKVEKTFENMNEAKKFFQKKFCVLRKDGNGSIFDFNCPQSLKDHYHPAANSKNDIVLSFKDCDTLFDQTWLNDGIIKFVLKSLNYVIYNQTSKSDVPHVLFGSPFDKLPIMVKKNNFKDIVTHIEYGMSSSQTFMDSEKACIQCMKYWYSKHPKDYLNQILDEYSKRRKDTMIKKYATVMNFGNEHWILLVANLSSDEEDFEPNVYTIDNMYDTDNEATEIRKWYAKFFGLYVKQYDENEDFADEDFDCHEFIRERNAQSQGNDNTEIGKSYLIHAPRERTIFQKDNHNCGLISLIQCVELFNEKEEFHKLKGNAHHQFLLNYRLRILSLIRDVFDLFHNKTYSNFEDHLCMTEGDPEVPSNLNKFFMVHELFDVGVFKYDKTSKKKFMNANSICKTTNMESLKALHREHFHTAESSMVTSPRPSSGKTLVKSPRTKTVSKKAMRKKKEATVFFEDDDDVPMQSLSINDIDQSRAERSVTDVNNVKLFLDPDKTAPEDAIHPRDLVAKLLTLFHVCYLDKEKTKKVQRDKFVRDVKNLMFRHSTYFIVDLVRNKNTREIQYEIIAAVIFEHTIHLSFIKHSIIHLIGIRPGYENKTFFKQLLFHVANTTRLKSRKLVVITRFGQFNYRMNDYEDISDNDSDSNADLPESLFRGIGFSTQIRNKHLQKAISEMTQTHSLTLYGDGEVLRSHCSVASSTGSRAKVLYLHANVKFMAMFQKHDKKFFLYDHPFGWNESNSDTLKYISRDFQDICRENPGRKVSLGGGGHRTCSLGKKLKKSDKIMRLPRECTQRAQECSNNCVWLSAALLIERINPEVAERMITLLNENQKKYEWMFLMKIPPKFQELCRNRDCCSLMNALQDRRINFKLCKINIAKLKMTYIDYILHPDTTGQFICQLEANGGDKFHVIGIDCNSNPKLILDPCEKYALRLSKSNIDYCCGVYLLGVKGFCYCYELRPNIPEK